MSRKPIKQVNKKAKKQVKPVAAPAPRSVPVSELKLAGYNPRKITSQQMDAICRSIVKFGFVEPIVIRAEDSLVIGGHQRVAALEYLAAGKYKVDGKPVVFDLPGGVVPTVEVSGLSDEEAKLLNLALNKVGGEWDFELLPKLLDDLVKSSSLEEVTISGFNAAEITDYLDVLTYTPPPGTEPGRMSAAPKVTLDFSKPEYRDAFKSHLAKLSGEGDKKRPTGDVIAKALGLIR